MGSGFDAIGLALELRCSVTVELGPPSFQLIGEGADVVMPSDTNVILNAIQQVFAQAEIEMPQLQVTCTNNIPIARGLGSSSAAIVGGLMAANEICGRPFSKAHLLNMATLIEGHPDNVAPALLGGCQLAIRDDGNVITSRIRSPVRCHWWDSFRIFSLRQLEAALCLNHQYLVVPQFSTYRGRLYW